MLVLLVLIPTLTPNVSAVYIVTILSLFVFYCKLADDRFAGKAAAETTTLLFH